MANRCLIMRKTWIASEMVSCLVRVAYLVACFWYAMCLFLYCAIAQIQLACLSGESSGMNIEQQKVLNRLIHLIYFLVMKQCFPLITFQHKLNFSISNSVFVKSKYASGQTGSRLYTCVSSCFKALFRNRFSLRAHRPHPPTDLLWCCLPALCCTGSRNGRYSHQAFVLAR